MEPRHLYTFPAGTATRKYDGLSDRKARLAQAYARDIKEYVCRGNQSTMLALAFVFL